MHQPLEEKYIIAIPSYRRAERLLSHKCTLSQIDKMNMNNTFLFVRDEEEEAYLPVAEHYGCGLILIDIPPDAGIPETRDEILHYAREHEVKRLIMIDDDTDFAFKPNPNKYINFTPGIFQNMVKDLIFYTTEEFPIVGISARQFSQNKKGISYNNRIIEVYSIYMPVITKEGYSFGEQGLQFMEDCCFVLTFLQKGYKNCVLNYYTRDSDSQTPGGCSVYRTVENHNASVIALYKKFPHLVTPYVKMSGTWKEPRLNFRIKWRKAYVERRTD